MYSYSFSVLAGMEKAWPLSSLCSEEPKPASEEVLIVSVEFTAFLFRYLSFLSLIMPCWFSI